jgi:hypothetical protein
LPEPNNIDLGFKDSLIEQLYFVYHLTCAAKILFFIKNKES